MKKNLERWIIFLVAILFPLNVVFSQDILGQERTFYIESFYDSQGREKITAQLVAISPRLYWYLDKEWWEDLSSKEKEEVKESIFFLIQEFEEKIYPKITTVFGSEWLPGIDKDSRITVLVHPMKNEWGGYFDTKDEYPKIQIPQSNEREMIYLNSEVIEKDVGKVFLAHEFVHLVTFNQKERKHGTVEDVWLNEARADYVSTFLGYDKEYEGSNLQKRVESFFDNPYDSLTEWKETQYDYGVVSLFTHYLVEHYGLDILTESLKLKETGIESINKVLKREGFKEDFGEIFSDWACALYLQNCEISPKYCYFNENLKKIKIVPLLNYLPTGGESTLSVSNTTKDWAGNWYKFIGGKGEFHLKFQAGGANFKVRYILEDNNGNITVKNLTLNEKGEGEISVSDFGTKFVSVVLIPIAQNKIKDFTSKEPSRSFSWTASIIKPKPKEEIPSLPPLKKPISQMTREEILERIFQIKNLILKLQQMLKEIQKNQISCKSITQDLYYGMRNNPQVKCLQEFLKWEGKDIYPEGLVTGNFFELTKKAVIRFQEKYKKDILEPLGLKRGTGYVGRMTRLKINELLGLTNF